MQDLEGKLQWHPAFYAGLQIELEHETEKLSFENEHQLGTKPKEIDVLIIKKENNYHLKKNIGRIFRKHNIIEYKSPSTIWESMIFTGYTDIPVFTNPTLSLKTAFR